MRPLQLAVTMRAVRAFRPNCERHCTISETLRDAGFADPRVRIAKDRGPVTTFVRPEFGDRVYADLGGAAGAIISANDTAPSMIKAGLLFTVTPFKITPVRRYGTREERGLPKKAAHGQGKAKRNNPEPEARRARALMEAMRKSKG